MEIPITDRESASLDGSAFGSEVATRTAQSMTAGEMSEDELREIGTRGIAEVAARAEMLVNSGIDRDLVFAWLQGAAEAFGEELDRSVRDSRGRDARH